MIGPTLDTPEQNSIVDENKRLLITFTSKANELIKTGFKQWFLE